MLPPSLHKIPNAPPAPVPQAPRPSLSLTTPIAVFVCTPFRRLGCLPSVQEVVLPLANDRRLPSDTLFLVFEAYYRFYPQGEDPDASDTYGDRLEALLDKRKRSRSPKQNQAAYAWTSQRVFGWSLPPRPGEPTRGQTRLCQPCTTPHSEVPRTVTMSTMASAQTWPTCCAWPRSAIGNKWGTSSGSDGVQPVMAPTRRGRCKHLMD